METSSTNSALSLLSSQPLFDAVRLDPCGCLCSKEIIKQAVTVLLVCPNCKIQPICNVAYNDQAAYEMRLRVAKELYAGNLSMTCSREVSSEESAYLFKKGDKYLSNCTYEKAMVVFAKILWYCPTSEKAKTLLGSALQALDINFTPVGASLKSISLLLNYIQDNFIEKPCIELQQDVQTNIEIDSGEDVSCLVIKYSLKNPSGDQQREELALPLGITSEELAAKVDNVVVLPVVSQHVKELKNDVDDLNKNKEVVLAVVKQSGEELGLANEALKNDKKAALADVKDSSLQSVDSSPLKMADLKRLFSSGQAKPLEKRSMESLLKWLGMTIEELKETKELKLPLDTTDEDLNSLIKLGPSLISLDLTGCKDITKKGFNEFILIAKRLKKLTLENCTQMTDDMLKTILSDCKNLTHLNLNFCKNVTDRGLEYIGMYCKTLVDLNLGFLQWKTGEQYDSKQAKYASGGISYTGIEAIIKNCKNLNVIELSHERVTFLEILKLMKFYTHYFTLILGDGAKLSEERVKAIIDVFTGCEEIELSVPLQFFLKEETHLPFPLECTDQGTHLILPYASQVTSLCIESDNITDRTLESIAKHCVSLKKLQISSESTTNRGLFHLVQKCDQLDELINDPKWPKRVGDKLQDMQSVAQCFQTPPESLVLERLMKLLLLPNRQNPGFLTSYDIAIIRQLHKICTEVELRKAIQSLIPTDSLQFPNDCTGEELDLVLPYTPQISSLTIQSNHITDQTLESIVKHCVSLKKLQISSKSTTNRGLIHLVQKHDQLDELIDYPKWPKPVENKLQDMESVAQCFQTTPESLVLERLMKLLLLPNRQNPGFLTSYDIAIIRQLHKICTEVELREAIQSLIPTDSLQFPNDCTDEEIDLVLPYTPQINSLNIVSNHITDQTLGSIVKHFVTLKKLQISSTSTTNRGLIHLVQKCDQLDELIDYPKWPKPVENKLQDMESVAQCFQTPPESLVLERLMKLLLLPNRQKRGFLTNYDIAIIRQLHKICAEEELRKAIQSLILTDSLGFPDDCTDEEIDLVLPYTPQINSLTIESNNITDKTLESIVKHCGSLKKLALSSKSTTNRGLFHLVQKYDQLDELINHPIWPKPVENKAIGLNLFGITFDKAKNVINTTHEELNDKLLQFKEPINQQIQIERLQKLKQELEMARDLVYEMRWDPEDLQLKAKLAIANINDQLTHLGIVDEIKQIAENELQDMESVAMCFETPPDSLVLERLMKLLLLPNRQKPGFLTGYDIAIIRQLHRICPEGELKKAMQSLIITENLDFRDCLCIITNEILEIVVKSCKPKSFGPYLLRLNQWPKVTREACLKIGLESQNTHLQLLADPNAWDMQSKWDMNISSDQMHWALKVLEFAEPLQQDFGTFKANIFSHADILWSMGIIYILQNELDLAWSKLGLALSVHPRLHMRLLKESLSFRGLFETFIDKYANLVKDCCRLSDSKLVLKQMDIGNLELYTTLCHNLENLEISGAVGEKEIEIITQNCPKLRFLDMEKCTRIEAIMDKCTNLKKIYLPKGSEWRYGEFSKSSKICFYDKKEPLYSGYLTIYINHLGREDRRTVLEAVSQEGWNLRYANETFTKDKMVVLAAVQQDGWALEFADSCLRNKEDVVLAAVTQNAEVIRYVDEGFKKNKKVVYAAVKQNGEALCHVDESFKKDRGVVLAAVRQNGEALQYADLILKFDRDVVLAAVRQNGKALRYASQELKRDIDIVLHAVMQNCEALQYVDQSSKEIEDVVLAALNQDGRTLRFADERFKKSKWMVLIAVQQNGEARQYADESLKNDQEILLAANSRK